MNVKQKVVNTKVKLKLVTVPKSDSEWSIHINRIRYERKSIKYEDKIRKGVDVKLANTKAKLVNTKVKVLYTKVKAVNTKVKLVIGKAKVPSQSGSEKIRCENRISQ